MGPNGPILFKGVLLSKFSKFQKLGGLEDSQISELSKDALHPNTVPYVAVRLAAAARAAKTITPRIKSNRCVISSNTPSYSISFTRFNREAVCAIPSLTALLANFFASDPSI